jgi:hypothetical protein
MYIKSPLFDRSENLAEQIYIAAWRNARCISYSTVRQITTVAVSQAGGEAG